MVEQIKDDHKIVITSNCVILLGLSQIENDYDSIWYMRHESYQYQYYRYCISIFRQHFCFKNSLVICETEVVL